MKKKLKTYLLNFGLQHPSAHVVLRLLLEMVGERVIPILLFYIFIMFQIHGARPLLNKHIGFGVRYIAGSFAYIKARNTLNLDKKTLSQRHHQKKLRYIKYLTSRMQIGRLNQQKSVFKSTKDTIV